MSSISSSSPSSTLLASRISYFCFFSYLNLAIFSCYFSFSLSFLSIVNCNIPGISSPFLILGWSICELILLRLVSRLKADIVLDELVLFSSKVTIMGGSSPSYI